MTAPAPSRGTEYRARRRTGQTVVSVAVLVLLLVPVIYLFSQLWTSTGAAVDTVDTERAAVSYARPLTKLLSALADAQYAAVRRADVDTSAVKASIDEVNSVDRRLGDPLQIRQRWAGLTHEIDGAVGQHVTGPAALPGYASALALTQALLERISDGSKVTRDGSLGSYRLTEVALQSLPEVIVNARRLASLAIVTDPPTSTRGNPAAARPDPRLTVAADRLAEAADEVGTGLRSGADYAVDLRLLGPLDEFAAAADDLSQTAAGFEVPNSGARDRVDVVSTRVLTTSQNLVTAVLNVFDAQLSARADGYTTQHRVLVFAGVVILLAVGILLWLRVAGPAARQVRVPQERGEGRHGYPVEPEGAVPEGQRRIPDLMDARDLLDPELVPAGRTGVRPRKRQEAPGPR